MADTTVQVEVNIKEATKNELLEMIGGTPQEALAIFQEASLTAIRAFWKKRLNHYREQLIAEADPIA